MGRVLLHLHDRVNHLGDICLEVAFNIGEITRLAVDYHLGLLNEILVEFTLLDSADDFVNELPAVD